MASFQFANGSQPFDALTEQAPIGPSATNSALLERREWPNLEISLPDIEPDFPAYPPEAVEVRNTFIHVASPNAEDADRPPLSCPASKIGWIEDLLEDRPPPPPAHPPPPAPPAAQAPEVLKQKEDFSLQGPRPVIRLENAIEVQAQCQVPMGRAGGGRAFGVIGESRGRGGQNAYMLPTAYSSTGDAGRSHVLPGAVPHAVPGAVPCVPGAVPCVPGPAPAGPLAGRDTTLAQKPQTKELPSVGSAGHAFGTCKPCGFFYAKGCLNGPACSFCHLCDRGEKKRRQKQKKACLKGGA